MSEPVGNSPRGENTPPVTRNMPPGKAEVAPSQSEAPREEIAPIVTGKVVKRKQSIFRKATRSLIADDAQSIGDFILVDVIVPAIRNLIADTIKGGTDRVLFGTSRNRRAGGGPSGGLRTRYDQIPTAGAPARSMSRESRARHDFDQIILDDYQEAIEVVDALIDRVDRYKVASVSDLYDMVGVTGSYADRSWGWRDLSTANVRARHGGFLIDLPQPEPLR